AAFMDGPEIEIFGNVQDGTGNTMNSGKVIIHGSAGDILGYSMRGGEIYVKQDVGYRSGIHMKSFLDKFPVIVIGGKAGHFLGEYMAGGIIIVLGFNSPINKMKNFYLFDDDEIVGDYIGTGMHGGKIFVRGEINNHKLGKEIIKSKISNEDEDIIKSYIGNYFKYFGSENEETIKLSDFLKLTPFSRRPYGKLYAY
ncbi:MAG: GltB/FmdC/FwdC-like GXGXG domain-containing protein, partial [Candidatus Humimicrobiaceae bacterium]